MDFRARPAPKNAKPSGLPKEVAQMAKQMGIDMSEMGGQAENMWSMLNDMHANDPEEYDEFIQKTMEDEKKENEEKDKMGKTFKPNADFVVKVQMMKSNGINIKTASGVKASGKLFVNFCQHEAIQRPLGTDGKPVVEDRPHLDGLQIPLVVSPLRKCSDGKGEDVAAVDVVLNPFCLRKCKENNVFRAQIVELGLNWVQQEQSVRLERGWKVIKSLYKGGGGKGGSEVVPFPVDESMLGEKSKDGNSSTVNNSNSNGKKKQPEVAPPPAELTQSSLLDAMKMKKQMNSSDCHAPGGDNASGDNFLGNLHKIDNISTSLTGESPSRKSKSGPLIQEVEVEDSPKIAAVSATKQMKGFLNSSSTKSAKPIYDSKGSSGDGMGGKGGTYERFMSKCKVVDTSSMSEEEQKNAMAMHAGKGQGQTEQKVEQTAPKKEVETTTTTTTTTTTATATTATTKTKTSKLLDESFKNLGNKGFLEGKNQLYGDDPSGASESGDGAFDVEFQKLMEAADPEFASQFSDPRAKGGEDESELNEVFASLAGALGSGGGDNRNSNSNSNRNPNLDLGGIDVEAIKKHTEGKKSGSNKKRAEEAKSRKKMMANAVDKNKNPLTKGNVEKAQIPFTAETNDNTVSITLNMEGGGGGKLSLADMDLQVSSSYLLINTDFGSANINLCKNGGGGEVDEDSVKAKFSQKKRTLKITMQKKSF